MLYQIVQFLWSWILRISKDGGFATPLDSLHLSPILTISFLQNRFSCISSVDSCPFTLYTLEVKPHFNFCWSQPFIHPEEFLFSQLLLSTMWSILVAFHEAKECFGIFCALRTPKLVIAFHIWFPKWQIEEEIYWLKPTSTLNLLAVHLPTHTCIVSAKAGSSFLSAWLVIHQGCQVLFVMVPSSWWVHPVLSCGAVPSQLQDSSLAIVELLSFLSAHYSSCLGHL